MSGNLEPDSSPVERVSSREQRAADVDRPGLIVHAHPFPRTRSLAWTA